MPKLGFNDVPVNQQQGKQGKLAALHSASWVLVLPFSPQSSLGSSAGWNVPHRD